MGVLPRQNCLFQGIDAIVSELRRQDETTEHHAPLGARCPGGQLVGVQ